MNVKKVLSCLLVIAASSLTQAAYLDSALLSRYVCRSRADDTRVMVPGSCTQYYHCLAGQAKLSTCPYFYDAVSQQCVTKNPGCVETLRNVPPCEGPCCGVSNGDFAVDPTNAAVYYLCQDNCIAERRVCENGLMFDLVKLECSSPSTCTDCTTSKPPCESTTTTCETTTTPCTATTTPCTTSPTTFTKTTRTTTTATTTTCTTTTTCITTTPHTTTTTCTTTTPCTTPTTPCTTTATTRTETASTTTCATTATTTSCLTTTTTCATATTTPPCTTTKAPCKKSSHYVLPSKMSTIEIQDYARLGCVNKPDGYLLPSLTKCNEYFICRNGRALPVSCGTKYFNVKTNSCDLPSNTGCIQANLI